MLLEYDAEKDTRNIRERGISLGRFADMQEATIITRPDARRDYGELRLRVWGIIDRRLHVAVITNRQGRTRVISLRRANAREKKRYEEETKTDPAG